MLITLALFLVSFNGTETSNNKLNLSKDSNILNTIGANVTLAAVQGLNVNAWAATVGSAPSKSGDSIYTSTINSSINFSWGTGSVAGTSRSDNVIVEYSGYITSPVTTNVSFTTDADDGVRIYLNDFLFYNDWVDKGGGGITVSRSMTANVPQKFLLQYYENGGGAKLSLSWNIGSGMTIIPVTAFTQTYPTAQMIFNSNGGSSVSSIIAEIGKPFDLPVNPSLDDYTFGGWFFDNNTFNNPVNTDFFPGTYNSNTTVYAKWLRNKFTVTFDLQQGLGEIDAVEATLSLPMPSDNLLAPTKSGFTFDGFFSEINGLGNKYYNYDMSSSRNWDINNDVTLYANWLKNHTLTIKNYDNTIIDNKTEILNFGQSPSLVFPETNPTRPGYTFYGYSSQIPTTMPNQDVEIFALYKTNFVNQDFSIGNLDKNYIGGSVTFGLDTNDPFSYYVFNNDNQQSTSLGVISRFGNDVFYGDGSSAIKFAEVDSIKNGVNGQDLKINFTNSLDSAGQLILNGNFESLVGWTTFNTNYPGLVDSLIKGSPSYLVTREQNYLELRISAEFQTSNSIAHGPYVESPSFGANIGEVITFDYWASSPKGEFDIYVYLIDINKNTITQILYERGDEISFAARKSFRYEIVENSAALKLIFVGGGYFTGLGNDKNIITSFFIDNVSKSQGFKSSNLVNDLIRSISLISSVESLKFTTITTQDSDNVSTVYSSIKDNKVDQTTRVEITDFDLVYSFFQNEEIIINLDFKNYFSDKSTPIKYYIINKNANNSFLSIDEISGVISGVGLNANVGIGELTIYSEQELEDDSGTVYYSDELNFVINIINVNDPVYYNQLFGEVFIVDLPNLGAISYQVPETFFLDIDANDTKTYSFDGEYPLCLSISANGLITGNCTSTQLSEPVTIKVVDSGGAYATGRIRFISGVIIVFDSRGGSSIETQIVNFGELLVQPVNPIRDHYDFDGWYVNTTFTEINKYNFNTQVSSNLTLYAKWTPTPYQITYVLNNGLNNQTNPNNYTIESSTINLLDPTRVGYTFNGWYADSLLTNESSIINFGSIGDKTFYAKWSPTPYQITYVLNNGLNNQLNTFTYNIETSTFSLFDPSRVGYDFSGWFENDNFNGSSISAINFGSIGDKTFYAKWSPIIYSINYFGMRTPIGLNPTTFTIESQPLNFVTNLSDLGYVFMGYYDNSDFKGNSLLTIPSGSIGDRNIFASWIKDKFNLVFKDDKGSILSSQNIEYLTTIDTSFFPATEKEGYEFIGWGNNLPSTMPANNVEVVAQFKPKQFKLAIKDSFGNIITNEMVEFEASLSSFTLNEIEVDGFEFEGWEPALPNIMPASDLEILGKYRELPKFKIIVYGTKDEILIELELVEKQEVPTISLPDLSNSNDFFFEGWDGEIPSIMPGSNVEIRPKGSKREVTLNLFSTDRTLISTIKAQVGSQLNLEIPSRLGYNFNGWVDQSGNALSISIMPDDELNLFTTWKPKIYTVLVTVGSNDFNLNVTFGEPVGNIVAPQLFGYRFEGWKNNLTGEFINSNTIFTTPDQINLVPVFTRLNLQETLVAATRLIADFFIRLFR